MLLQQAVTRQAQVRPDAVALVFGDTRMTYAALEETSNRLARLLIDTGCQRGDRVALLMPKTPTAIVAILGVLKADAIYVPLDSSSPAARLARMLEVSDCSCILCAGPVDGTLRDVMAVAKLRRSPIIGRLDEYAPPEDAPPEDGMAPAFTPPDLAAYPATPPAYANTGADIAHILFTSGSTGMPKGVMITHSNVMHFIRWATAYFGASSSDRISQHPPLHFDLSTFDIFGTLSMGAELHLVPQDMNLLPQKLAQFICDARLTQWFSVPSVLNMMAKFDVVVPGDFPDLRRILWCGEAIPNPTLIYWMRRLPHVRFTNLYGPTEATIASSYYTVPCCPVDPQESIPIGSACDGEELLVLDEHLRPVAAGEIGDLYIRGAGLSPGYWRDPEKTRNAFLPYPGGTDPNDRIYKTGDLARLGAGGLLHFLGRADTQIKSRGYRIELGEIEAALNSLPGLRESAVVAIQSDGFEGWKICCAYAPAPDRKIPPEMLRKRLAALLPGYMLPSQWMRLDSLPKNANGKIDRPGLKQAFLDSEPRLQPIETPSTSHIAGEGNRLTNAVHYMS
ncbi:MAG: amino acid adenylation domain-containing protein [Betaproteobacteria bacterium]|nr:amino acid adenylation domain-containing protein [Betaproteobacteria bacterium]